MPGKPYTMKELKQIVDYLTEHKLYGDSKGRKMWMDFANTKKMERTWQSMKETFQKRILPDIHNPYYKLTLQQISSFRSGVNLEQPDTIQLVVHGSDSNSNGDNQGNIDQASTSKKNSVMSPKGKEPKKVSNKSSSTETLVLDTLETVEDVLNESDSDKTHKPLRDLFIYSEPLTPMLQEVLDDFATDEDEPRMQIVEDNENDAPTESPPLLRESRSLKLNNKDVAKKTDSKPDEAPSPNINESSDKIKPVKLIKTQSGAWESKDSNKKASEANDDSVAIICNATDSIITVDSSEQRDNSEDVLFNTQNKTNDITTNETPDSLLPNNPEAFNTTKKTSNETAITCSGDNSKSDEKKRKGEQLQAEPERKLRKSRETSIDVDTQISVINSLDENNKDDPNDTTKNVTSGNKDKLDKEHSKMNDADVNNSETNQKSQEDPDINPCLKSVSLYEEQFSQSKYSDSDADNQVTTAATKEANNNNLNAIVNSPVKSKNLPEQKSTDTNKVEESKAKVDTAKNTNHVDKSNEVNPTKTLKQKLDDIIITSDSESDSCKVIKKMNKSLHVDRRKVLANVFGFTSGTVTKKRTLSLRDKSKKRHSQRRRTNTYSILNTVKSTDSTGNSSLSDTDDIQPSPNKRKCHNDDKFIKPQPLNIMKCPGGGGLFVMDGNKLYPIVKHDKHVKNFLTIHDESDSESESYWKTKYLEQKRKNERLVKLTQNVLPISNKESVTRATSPMIVITNDEERQSKALPVRARSESGKESLNGDVNGVSDKKVRIKIGKNYESVELECQSGEVMDILEKMKVIMSKTSTDNNAEPNGSVVLSSGKSTPVLQAPVDPDVRARVDKIESEIFKEIAERDDIEDNVNKNKRIRPRKASSISVTNISPRSPSPKETEKPIEQPTENIPLNDVQPVDDAGDGAKKGTLNPKKLNPELEQKVKVRTSARLSSVSSNTVKNDVVIPVDDSQVLYKFPTSAPPSRSSSRARKKTQKAKFTKKIPITFQSPNDTLGYQDTDSSFVNLELRRKRKSTTYQYKGRHVRSKFRRKSDPYQGDDDTNEGFSVPNIAEKSQNSSLDPEAYKSESFQLLMPKPKVVRYLDKVEEGVINENNSFIIKSDSQSPNTINVTVVDKIKNGSPSGNSSNLSFPLSPELSIVENISISKSLLSSVNENPPSIQEMQDNDDVEVTDLNKYLLSHIDVSVPLMEQKCYFQSNVNKQRKNIVLETEGQNTVNMDEPSSSDSLDQKLRDLLLESAKKMTQTINMEADDTDQHKMEVDTILAKATVKKISKKRCSTPCKRRDAKKSKASIDPVIQEHTESCSHVSRSSYPAIMNVADKENKNVSSPSTGKNTEVKKVRRKKDIIKVKIQKPKEKKSKTKRAKSSSRMSVCTDSGINDTESGVFLQGLDDSVELIHNHSDTCLHANECVSDSVEFIDNELNSVFSIESSPRKSVNYSQMASENEDFDDECQNPEMFCNNAQDATSLKAIKEQIPKETETLSRGTVYHTPNSHNSFNSLVTEDLSDEALLPSPPLLQNKPSKWYIWSEDDTNVDFHDAASRDNAFVGANLHQIFPVTCAIPNLSTITENSTDSRKFTDIDTGNAEARSFASPRSIFDI